MRISKWTKPDGTKADLAVCNGKLASIMLAIIMNIVYLKELFSRLGVVRYENSYLNMAKSYMEEFAEHMPPFLDKAEFDRDFESRTQIELRQQLLSSLAEQLADTKTLLDYDNYHNALVFYRNMRYLSNENVPGTNVIYDDMRQFFMSMSAPAPAPVSEPPVE